MYLQKMQLQWKEQQYALEGQFEMSEPDPRKKKDYIKLKNHHSKKTLIQLFYNIITRDNKCLTATKMCFYVILRITLSL